MIQKKISELIDELSRIGGCNESIGLSEYIVLAIDDLDLNTKYGYNMLEQLQKYFSYHKIIILLAIDYKQMVRVCEENFIRAMKGTSKEEYFKRHNTQVANDYMTKIFHYSQRMYMPDTDQMLRKSSIRIDICDRGENKRTYIIAIKKFIMCKIAECMNIYYDACGLKMHFCEPKNIRELVSYNEFLESLNLIAYDRLVFYHENISETEKESNRAILKDYDENYERFREDVKVRLAQTLLNSEQKHTFDELISIDMERHAMYFVSFQKVNDRIVLGEINENDYTYGQLLEKINIWGREFYEDKPFISCVMAILTVEMVREYMHFCHSTDYNKREKHGRRLVRFAGKTIENGWMRCIMPTAAVLLNRGLERINLGGMKIQKGAFFIGFGMEPLIKWDNNGITDDSAWKELEEDLTKWLEKEDIIATLELIDIFCVRRESNRYWGIEYTFNQGIRMNSEINLDDVAKKEKENFVLLVDIMWEDSYYLDVMAFVLKSMNYKEERDRRNRNIVDNLVDFLQNYIGIDTEDERNTLNDLVERMVCNLSIYKGVSDESYFFGIPFPFYNLDLSYNIIKRIRREHKDECVQEKDIYNCIERFWKELDDKLQQECAAYAEKSSDNVEKELCYDGKKPDYLDEYHRCPYYEAINSIKGQGHSIAKGNVEKIFKKTALYWTDTITQQSTDEIMRKLDEASK